MMPRFVLRHIVVFRAIAILLLPVLIFGIPTLAYVHNMRAGTIPTKHDWDSTTHSSGPWAGGLAALTSFYLTLAGIAVGVVCAIRRKFQKKPFGIWLVHLGLVVAAALGVLTFFGYLID